MAGNGGWPLVAEDLNPTTTKSQILLTTSELGREPRTSDETVGLATPSSAFEQRIQLNHVQTPELPMLLDNEQVLL